jgi:hypothetical protein
MQEGDRTTEGEMTTQCNKGKRDQGAEMEIK